MMIGLMILGARRVIFGRSVPCVITSQARHVRIAMGEGMMSAFVARGAASLID